MPKTRDNILVGLVIAVAVVVAVVGSLWLARGGLSKGYPLYADFKWGAGLKTGSPVWVSGAAVGYVSDVAFRPDGTLQTELRITNTQPIPKGSVARVVPNGLFGDVAVNFTPIMAPQRYAANDTVVAGEPPPGIAELTAKADSISGSVNAITTALNKELVAGGGIADLRKTLAGTNALVAELNQIAAEQSKQLTLTMASLRKTVAAVDSAKIDSTITNLRTTSTNMATLTRTLDSTTLVMNQIVGKIDHGDGTAAKLINDSTLYDNLLRLTGQADSVLADLKKNPRKYINLKIF
jgi:phospholipid/cholesterol/gamma-HCH transport system substrate-binding protein